MGEKAMKRRSILKQSGTALAALSGVSFVGNAAGDIGDPGGGGGGGGGGGSGSPPTLNRLTTSSVSGDHVNVTAYLDSMGDDSTVSAWFNWGPEGEGLPYYTRQQFLDSTGSFCDGYNCSYDSFGALDPGTYEFEAYAENYYGSDTSPIDTFTI